MSAPFHLSEMSMMLKWYAKWEKKGFLRFSLALSLSNNAILYRTNRKTLPDGKQCDAMCAYIFRKFDLQETIVARPVASFNCVYYLLLRVCIHTILNVRRFGHKNPPSLPIPHKFYSISASLQHNSFISIFTSRHSNSIYSNSNSFLHFILSLRYGSR